MNPERDETIPAAVAIAPHLDDVALGCAGFAAAHPGTLVVTVMAGKPGHHSLTSWDRQCGFHLDDDVVGARRKEDEMALPHLKAVPHWLDFLDHQYGPQPGQRDVERAIEDLVLEATWIAMPLGIHHEDHLLVAAACRGVARGLPRKTWVVYEDVIYRATVGGTDERVAELRKQGFDLVPASFAPAAHKRAAVEAYASQVRGLGDLLLDAFEPERYWTMKVRA